jgi:hypothetical protein
MVALYRVDGAMAAPHNCGSLIKLRSLPCMKTGVISSDLSPSLFQLGHVVPLVWNDLVRAMRVLAPYEIHRRYFKCTCTATSIRDGLRTGVWSVCLRGVKSAKWVSTRAVRRPSSSTVQLPRTVVHYSHHKQTHTEEKGGRVRTDTCRAM